jgi:hypothetical protein
VLLYISAVPRNIIWLGKLLLYTISIFPNINGVYR